MIASIIQNVVRRCICKYVGDDDDDDDCPMTCCDSIEKCHCNRKCFIRLTYEKVGEYVDKDRVFVQGV